MPKIIVNITEENISEWIHSIGFFLPRNNKEEARFEKLNADIIHNLNINDVDPMALLNGSWKPHYIINLNLNTDEINQEISELRMAARNYDSIPEEIFEKMKKNQENNESPHNTES